MSWISLGQKQHNHLPLFLGLRDGGIVNFRKEHLPQKVAHEVFVGRANGVCQPEHSHLSQERQRHTQDRAIEGQPVHTLFHGSSKQHLVEGHVMASFNRCLANASPPSSDTLGPSATI